MTGLIWLVQLVHYPAFHFVDQKQFSDFHFFHSQRITWIVLPIMFVELVTAVLLFYTAGGMIWGLNLLGVLLLWLATALLSVPIHNQLAIAPTPALVENLIWTNWPRTILWTLRSAFLIFSLLPWARSPSLA